MVVQAPVVHFRLLSGVGMRFFSHHENTAYWTMAKIGRCWHSTEQHSRCLPTVPDSRPRPSRGCQTHFTVFDSVRWLFRNCRGKCSANCKNELLNGFIFKLCAVFCKISPAEL